MDNYMSLNDTIIRPKEIGHKYIGEIPELKEGELYDVEEWTPIAGGNYIGTIAIKITKEEVQFYIDKDKKDQYEWQHSNHWFSWRNGIRVVPHQKRTYLALHHESKCPSTIYDFTDDDNRITLYNVLHLASKDFDYSERLFSKEDLDKIVEKEITKRINNIKSKLTSTQNNILQKGLNKLNL